MAQYSEYFTIEVPQARYEELRAAEERLKIIETAIINCRGFSSDIDVLKQAFDLKENAGK